MCSCRSETVIQIDHFTPTLPDQIHKGNGIVQLDYTVIGKDRFIVQLIEPGGDWPVLWDGGSYEEAILTAEELARDFGCGVVDRVATRAD